MSFLFKGDEGPTNIPEGRAGGLFQAIAQAGLQAAQENNFGGRRRVRSRMAGQKEEGRRRSRLDDMRSPRGFLPYHRGGDPRGSGLADGGPRPPRDIGLGGGPGDTPPSFPKGPKSPRGYLPHHRGPSKGTKHVTMRDPETGYKYGGKVVDGVPQFTKPDFSDRKPNRPPRKGPGIRPPRDEVSIMPVPPRDEVSIMPVPPRPEGDRNRGREGGRGRRRVRDEAFERRRRSSNRRKTTRRERRRRVRNANTPMIK